VLLAVLWLLQAALLEMLKRLQMAAMFSSWMDQSYFP
jgi:hypothetical protein